VNRPDPSAADRFAATVAALGSPRDLRSLPVEAMHLVMGMRLCALFLAAGRDPVAELATRLGSVTAACHILDLSRAVARTWPEPYTAARPCCMCLSPDEATLAAMGEAVIDRDHRRFAQALEGFVRADRHEHLRLATIRAVAALADLPGSR